MAYKAGPELKNFKNPEHDRITVFVTEVWSAETNPPPPVGLQNPALLLSEPRNRVGPTQTGANGDEGDCLYCR